METWQIDHIRKNFPSLLHITSCSSIFLASLHADGIVSNEEVGILVSISTQMARANRLYEIIQTRKGSFNPLKQALKDTSQSGTLAILDQANNNPDVPIPFKSCGSISYIRDLLLGRGCYGTRVFKGKLEYRDVAVKRVDRDEVEMADVQGEIHLLTLLDYHKNVVRYFKTEVSDEYIFIAMELCDINLFDWVMQPQKTVEIGAIEVIKQSTEGVAHLHSNRVIHRDLKPSNIMLVVRSVGDTQRQVKISDFGLSKRIPVGVSKLSSHTAGVGTVEWMAPEVAGGLTFQNNVAVGMSFKSDVFSLGCVYYFVLSSGLHPFGEPRRCQANIMDGKYQLDEQNITKMEGENASGFIRLISKMIAHERSNRPTVAGVLTWLRDLTTSQKSGMASTHRPNPIENEPGILNRAKKPSGRKFDEYPRYDDKPSLIEKKFGLAKVIERKSTQLPTIPGTTTAATGTSAIHKSIARLSIFPGTALATPDVQLPKWEDTKEHRLHLAIERGDMEAIQIQIQLGADVNTGNCKNETPLMIAASSEMDGNIIYDIIKYLLDHGANAFVVNSEGRTFLHKLFLNSMTSSSGFGAFAEYLVGKKLAGLFNSKDIITGATPLMLAVRNLKLDMATLSLLMKNGVDITLVDKNDKSCQSYAAEGNKNLKLFTELTEIREMKRKRLAEAIKAKDWNLAKVILELEIDVNELEEMLLRLDAASKNRNIVGAPSHGSIAGTSHHPLLENRTNDEDDPNHN